MDIKIFDNFLDPIDFRKVIDDTISQEWGVQRSDFKKEHLHFLMLEVSDEEFYNKYLFNKINEQLGGEYKLERIYFNGQWTGREGTFHHDGCDLTALLYVSEYEYGWGGFTEIMISETEQALVHPIPNRLCLFPGRIMHKGYSFCYQFCPMRISLAFKLNTK